MSVLMVTGNEAARAGVKLIAAQLGMDVEMADGRKGASTALRQKEFTVVVVDETLAECDPAAADTIWEKAGLAIPLQINFALAGTSRLVREIRAALYRRGREQALARQAATEAIETELKSTLAGLLLHSQLALTGELMPGPASDRLRLVAELAGSLRQKLSEPAATRGQSAA